MQKSILFTNAVLISRHALRLNADRIKRMINAATIADAAKILFECGYDEEIITFQPEKDDLIVKTELERTVKTLKELCPDDNLTKLLLAKFDYHNAKVFYSAKFFEIDLYETAYSFGSIDVKKQKKGIETKKYSELPVAMREALENLDKKQNPSSAEIDFQFEKAMFADIVQRLKQIKNKPIEKYFRTDIDFTNIRTSAKCEMYGVKFDDFFIPGGYIDKRDVKPPSDFNKFESESNVKLIKISEEEKENNYKLNIVFNWFVMKLEELKVVKLILIGKKFELSKKHIKDNLREAYEEFR